MAADLNLLRQRLLPFTKVRSTCRLDSLALSRHHALLPERSWSDLSSPSAPIRSCFQWMFHPSCDVLNFPPVDIELGQDGNPVIVPEFRRMWVSGSMKFHSPFFPDDTASKETTIVDVSSRDTKSQGPVIFVSRESTMTTMSTTEQSQKGGSRGRMTETTTHAFLQSTRYVPPPSLDAAAAPSLPVSERHPLLLEETVKDIDSVLLFKYSAQNTIKSNQNHIFIFSKLYSLCVHITSSTKICRMVIWYYHMNECVHLPYSHVMFHRNVMQSPTAVSPRLDLDFVCCVRCWCSGCLVTDSQNNGWIFVWVIFSLLLWLLLS